jgi:hypothetical protein
LVPGLLLDAMGLPDAVLSLAEAGGFAAVAVAFGAVRWAANAGANAKDRVKEAGKSQRRFLVDMRSSFC